MKNLRYGKFNYKDFIGTYIVIIICLFLAITSIVLELEIYISIIWFLPVLLRPCFIIKQYHEKFKLHENEICIYKGKKVEKIIFPDNISLIISYADILPSPLSIRTPIGNETHILKNKYAVSILYEKSLDAILKKLHTNNLKKYTTSVIENLFNGNEFIYSFVCNKDLFDSLTRNKNITVVIPKSLIDKIDFDYSYFETYIDKEC